MRKTLLKHSMLMCSVVKRSNCMWFLSGFCWVWWQSSVFSFSVRSSAAQPSLPSLLFLKWGYPGHCLSFVVLWCFCLFRCLATFSLFFILIILPVFSVDCGCFSVRCCHVLSCRAVWAWTVFPPQGSLCCLLFYFWTLITIPLSSPHPFNGFLLDNYWCMSIM